MLQEYLCCFYALLVMLAEYFFVVFITITIVQAMKTTYINKALEEEHMLDKPNNYIDKK